MLEVVVEACRRAKGHEGIEGGNFLNGLTTHNFFHGLSLLPTSFLGIKMVLKVLIQTLNHIQKFTGICIVQRLLKLQPFSPQLMLSHLKSVFSTQWDSYVNDMGIGPWVSWDYGPGSQCKGPSLD